jgi:hypothetical protein
VWLKGDTVTALSWMDKGHVKSSLAINASMVAVMQSVHANMPVLGGIHVPAADNKLADKLSRTAQAGLSVEDLVSETPELHGVDILELGMGDVLPLCNPLKVVDSQPAFGAFWSRVRDCLPLHRCGPSPLPRVSPGVPSDHSEGGVGCPSESPPPYCPTTST